MIKTRFEGRGDLKVKKNKRLLKVKKINGYPNPDKNLCTCNNSVSSNKRAKAVTTLVFELNILKIKEVKTDADFQQAASMTALTEEFFKKAVEVAIPLIL